jgi:hypothetical protein
MDLFVGGSEIGGITPLLVPISTFLLYQPDDMCLFVTRKKGMQADDVWSGDAFSHISTHIRTERLSQDRIPEISYPQECIGRRKYCKCPPND